jgi:hypothetical protein
MGPDDILRGWNAIAEFLRCDVRTAKRWETKRSLPVRRTWREPGEGRPNVYAVAAELRAWKAMADAAAKSQRTVASAKKPPLRGPLPEAATLRRLSWALRAPIIALLVISMVAATIYVVRGHSRSTRRIASPKSSVSPTCSLDPDGNR